MIACTTSIAATNELKKKLRSVGAQIRRIGELFPKKTSAPAVPV